MAASPYDETAVAGPSRLAQPPKTDSIDLTEDSDGEPEAEGGVRGDLGRPSIFAQTDNGMEMDTPEMRHQGWTSSLPAPAPPDRRVGNGQTHGPTTAQYLHRHPSFQSATTSMSPRLPPSPAFGSSSFSYMPHTTSSTIYHPNPHSSPHPHPSPSTPQDYSNGHGYSNNHGNGSSSTSAIDLTSANIPSPPPRNRNAPLFIGAITTEAFMLYPSPLVNMGADISQAREKLDLVYFRGAEFLKVKLKVSRIVRIVRRRDEKADLSSIERRGLDLSLRIRGQRPRRTLSKL